MRDETKLRLRNRLPGGGGVLLGIFGGGVPPASLNPDPISDQKMPFPTPVFRYFQIFYLFLFLSHQ